MSDRAQAPVILAAVEGGGTTFVVAVAELVGTTPKILHKEAIDSSHDNPQKTLQDCVTFLTKHKPVGGYHALGIASFGPVGVKETNPQTYGSILGSSPKENWRNVNLLKPLAEACEGPERPLKVKVDTDVNAPALAEFLVEKSGISSLAYVTVGTGVGVGLVIHGKCVHGRMHPEGGHVPVQPLPDDPFHGYSWSAKSPFQGKHTVEGIACSVALTERLQQMKGASESLDRNVLSDLPDDHVIWDHAANALANLCVTLLLTTSMEKIVLGGGIMKRRGLMDKIRTQTVTLLNGYIELPIDMSSLIAEPYYGETAGLMGAVVLAQESLKEEGVNRKEKEKWNFYHGLWHGILIGVAAATVGAMALKSRGRHT